LIRRDVLAEELIMTMSALKARPKVYWIWNHRRWCLENIPDGPGEAVHGWKQDAWNKELFVVQKMLDADPRNCMFFLIRFQSPLYPFPELSTCSFTVLAWDYRRYILSEMPTPPSEITELAYTSKKIESNFSNFSAWHQRSKTLASLWVQGKLDESKSREEGVTAKAVFSANLPQV
jgi:geranylgeranyl transferase type-2 subunit alpha